MSKYDDSDILSYLKKDKLKQMGKQIEDYLDFVDKYLFIEGCTDEEYKRIKKNIKKVIKKLKKGKDLETILDVEKIEECAREDMSFASEYLEGFD